VADFENLKKTLGSSEVDLTQAIPFGQGAALLAEFEDLNKTLCSGGVDLSNALLRLTVVARGQDSDGDIHTHTAYFHPTSLARSPLRDPGLKLETLDAKQSRHDQSTADTVSFRVRATKAVAAWVWIDYTSTEVQGYCSDNGFWLTKGESREVTFTIWNDWSGGKWTDSMTVRSLWDKKQQG
jgi:beta-mannosidase